jgi:Ca2+-transporting ATPase
VINGEVIASILIIGATLAVTGLPLFFYTLKNGGDLVLAQTQLFTMMVLAEMAIVQVIRRRYEQSILSNLWLILAIASSVFLHGLVIYTPLAQYFQTQAIGLREWAPLAIALAVFVVLNQAIFAVRGRFVENRN